MNVRVRCHAGHRGEEEPRVLTLGAREVAVARVADRWIAPDHRYFKVIGDDGATYILRHDIRKELWEVTFYDRRAPG